MSEPQDARAWAEAMLARPPLHAWLGVRVSAVDETAGSVTVTMPHRAEFSRSPDRADYHGGIIATLIDLAGHVCLATKLRRRAPTIDMRVDYMRPAVDTALHATGTVVRAGRSIGLCDVVVRDDAGRELATGRCVFSTRED